MGPTDRWRTAIPEPSDDRACRYLAILGPLMLIVAGVVIRAGVFAPDTVRSILDANEGRRDRRRALERSADGFPYQVRDERGGATEGELPQSAADSRALGEGTHPDTEQEQRGKGDDDTADER